MSHLGPSHALYGFFLNKKQTELSLSDLQTDILRRYDTAHWQHVRHHVHPTANPWHHQR